MAEMTSTRPYLLRAIYEWLCDNNHTPHMLVDSTDPRVQVPRQYAQDGRIVLNVSPSAVRDLKIDNDEVRFSARFGGVAMVLHFPVQTVQAIYSRENGQGMFFEPEDEPESPPPGPEQPSEPPKDRPSGKPSLRVVK